VEDFTMAGRLDRIDLKILRLLQNSGRLTNTELAETAGVSAATCHRRTQRLFDEGYIPQVRAMVAPRKVGKGALVMVGVVLDRSTPESFAAFERAIAQLKFVLATWSRAISTISSRSGSATWRTSTASMAND
jgi:Lrp/AsnC family leucine-responsive transcriptional regulator